MAKQKGDSPDTKPAFYKIENVRCIDGDAIEADILLPFGLRVRKRIRLSGFWAPELTGRLAAQGRAAKRCLELFVEFRELWIKSPSDRLDRYGRLISQLWTKTAPVNPNEVLGRLALTPEEHATELKEINPAEHPAPEPTEAPSPQKESIQRLLATPVNRGGKFPPA
jgi:hypothetical protein